MPEKKQTQQDFSFLNNDDNAKGFEKIGMSEQAIPFIRIAQAISPQVQKSKPEYIEGLQPGDIFNTVTKEIYGKSLEIVCGGFEHVYIEWPPERASSGGPVAIHDADIIDTIAVDKSEFGKWKSKDGNKLQENYMYYVIVPGKEAEGIAVIPMKSTEIKVAKAWNRVLLNKVMPTGKKAMPHWLTWNLETTETSNSQGTWYQYRITWKGYVTEELHKAIKTERECLPSVSSLDTKQLEAPEEGSSEENKDDKVSVNY